MDKKTELEELEYALKNWTDDPDEPLISQYDENDNEISSDITANTLKKALKQAKQEGYDKAKLTIEYYRQDRDNWAKRFLELEKLNSK